MKIEEKTILWKPVSEYTGGRVLATNGLDILVGELNHEGDCVSEDCSGIHLCGITHFAKIAGFFPELKESEDEKIRKALIDYFDDANKADENPLQSYGIHTDKAIAWLEKQGGQKPAEWSEEMGKLCLDAIELLRDYASGVDKNSQLGMKICRADAFLSDLYHDAFYPSTYNMREDLRKTEWSEEDELQMNAAIDICKNLGYTPTSDWLKSLKLRNHWKPTEEQVSTMKYLAKYYAKGCDEPTRSIIEGLYEQLKQL